MTTKPLGGKAYGSTPHLPGSRMGPGDHHCHDGQATICTSRARDRHDRVIVTEKLDGCCMSVARIGKNILALGRAGYPADSAPYEHMRIFSGWVRERESVFASLLKDGERVVGEWMAMAHGTIYRLWHEPFVAFALVGGDGRVPHDCATDRFFKFGIPTACVLSDGPPMPIDRAMRALGDRGFHGAQEEPEGAVWRVERRGKFDFLAKYVRPSKIDGKYLPNISGNDPIWNWTP